MRIDSYSIGMDSERLYRSSESSRKYVGTSISDGSLTGRQLSAFQEGLDREKESEENEEVPSTNSENSADTAMNRLSSAVNRRKLLAEDKSVYERFQELHELMVRNILALLFGEKTVDDLERECATADAGNVGESYELVTQTDSFSWYYEETEAVSFSTQGVVNTADGRQVNIDLNISMSRSFSAYYEERYSRPVIRTCDPLVINLDDCLADVKRMDFFFDLDCDGEKEKISELKAGSGYLALDKNGDGIINDGSELFGTESGDGFYDLSRYDEDRNGWIDENDAIFNALKIWVRTDEGEDVLYTLKDKNVGALFLGSTDTEFSLNAMITNETKAVVRSTGLFLYEDGSAGTLQHVDLVS